MITMTTPVLNLIITLTRTVTVATELLTISFLKEEDFKSALKGAEGVGLGRELL